MVVIMSASDFDWMFKFSATLLGVGRILFAMECIWLFQEYGRGGMFDWNVLRQRSVFKGRIIQVLSDWVYRDRGMKILILIHVLIGLWLMISFVIPNKFVTLGLWFAVSGNVVIFLRSPVGQEGSDQMTIIVSVALACGGMLGKFDGVLFVCHLFIAGQLILSYFVAGVAKVFGPLWRSGYAIEKILSSECFGAPRVGEWLSSRKTISKLICWSVIIFECSFPLILFLPVNWVWTFLGIALMFHVGNAILMGLNGFLWPFVAAYPSILYVTQGSLGS